MKSATITPQTNGDLIFAGLVEMANGSGDACTATGGFTARANQCSADGLIDEDYIQPLSGTISASATLAPSSANYITGIAAFRAATTGTDTTAPTIPTNLSASGVTTSGVTLAWSASTDSNGVAGYHVIRNGTQIGTTASTSYTDSGLTAGTSYTYAVNAFDPTGNTSLQSATLQVTTKSSSSDTTPPSVPANLKSTAATSTSISLAWTASTDNVGVFGYHLFRNGTQVASPSGNSYTDTGLAAGTSYTYAVSAYDAAGNASAQSASLKVSTTGSSDTTPPSVPANLKSTATTSSSVSLAWTASTDNVAVAGYHLFRNGTQVASPSGNSYTDTGLAAATSYTYTVSAYDAAGNASAQSASLKVTTTGSSDTTPPSVPANLTSTAVTSSSVSLAWTASTDNVAVIGYHLFRNGTQVASPSGNSYTDTGLAAATSYTYTVNAYDAAGNVSAQSTANTATTAASTTQAQAPAAVYPLKISSNGRYLVDQNNNPFFITGEQGWSLITQLSNSDVDVYLTDRQSRGYNVIWLGAADNTYQSNAPNDYYGNKPFDGADFTNEDATYWSHVDYIVQRAASFGMTLMLDPAFVGLGNSDGYYASYLNSSDAVMTAYGAWIGARYRNSPNIIWALGGDADPAMSGLYGKITDLANGIRSADTAHLITFEASRFTGGAAVANGGYSSLDVWPGPPSWLNLNWVYLTPTYIPSAVETNYSRSPWLPPFLGEDWCEGDHSITPLGMREEAYEAILGGAYLGRVFCNDAIWSFGVPAYDTLNVTWQSQLDSNGSVSQETLGKLFRSREHWLLVPDTNHTVMTAGYQSGSTLAVTARTSDAQSIIAYIPTQRAVTIDMTKISGAWAQGWWFNPQTGAAMSIGAISTAGSQSFTPPDSNDWVLVIDAETANLGAPGGGS